MTGHTFTIWGSPSLKAYFWKPFFLPSSFLPPSLVKRSDIKTGPPLKDVIPFLFCTGLGKFVGMFYKGLSQLFSFPSLNCPFSFLLFLMDLKKALSPFSYTTRLSRPIEGSVDWTIGQKPSIKC